MDKTARSTPETRSQLFTQTGAAMDLAAHLAEKDFWVCWTLKRLFSIPDIREHLIFKGGTTLSKVHGIINRFSEDIDLTLDREAFGFNENPEEAPSRKKRDLIIAEMAERCGRYVRGELKNTLRKQFTLSLPEAEWDLVVDPDDSDGQTLFFHYPTVFRVAEYTPPTVKLEFGSKSDLWPTEESQVISYAAKHFSKMFEDPYCGVNALSAERTFWEKATILHQVAHWPANKPLLPRYSRHYYDLAMLADSKFRTVALEDVSLLNRVVTHKIMYFRCGWANYQTATPGTFKLVPPKSTITQLKKDYNRMSDMIFGEIPTFDNIMERLAALEHRINTI